MESTQHDFSGLERSCGPEGQDWVRIAPGDGPGGPERIEACFGGQAYAPHRHDTYAIGVTLNGVQSFTYRGEVRNSLAGNAIVLHPDELHDGRSGAEGGFRYRMLYIDPDTIREALPDAARSLPFVGECISRDPAFRAAATTALQDIDQTKTGLEWASDIADIAQALARLDPATAPRRGGPADVEAVRRAKQAMLNSLDQDLAMGDLESITGQSRFALARHFRAVSGISPHRWLVMRRLDRARAALQTGATLSAAAAEAGFADQAHMTRHFKNAFGMTPGQWRERLKTQPAGAG